MNKNIKIKIKFICNLKFNIFNHKHLFSFLFLYATIKLNDIFNNNTVYNESLNIKLLIDEIYNVVKYDNFEIIVINDCSNDNTLEILKKLKINIKILFIIL